MIIQKVVTTLPVCLFLYSVSLFAQADSSSNASLQQLSSQYISSISFKAAILESKLDKQSEKALAAMMKEEAKIKKQLQKKDSLLANSIFGDAAAKYKGIKEKVTASSTKVYIPLLDTLKTSLHFLEQHPELIEKTKDAVKKLKDAMSRMKGMEDKFQQAETIKQFLKERKQFLKDQLSKLGFAKQLKKINKQVYYYSQQLNEVKDILKDQKKAERKAIELLSKTKFFQEFMRKNSMLASLFRMPGDPNDPANMASLAGLQTRSQVNNIIQQQLSAGGPNAMQQFQQNVQGAQAQLSLLKDKVMKLGGGSSDAEMPEGFKPNDQKTKSFLKRLEYGTNVQTQSASAFFPVTSDIGLSLGYKLNDKSIIGIGASYKLGFGRGWNNIRFTQQGAGLRSFVDWKIKGNFWASGGYEMNYRTAFNSIDQLKNLNAWQTSGLLGISKSIPVKTKFFKKTKMQLLWDFMSYEQVPRTQPIVFRVGYNF